LTVLKRRNPRCFETFLYWGFTPVLRVGSKRGFVSIKTRLEALEGATLPGIVLTLDDGSTIEYPGPALEFYAEAQEQISRKRGPLYKRPRHIVRATGFGKLQEVLLAMVEAPVDQGIGDDSCSHRRHVARTRRKP
jgi:hypothetical protein